MATPTEARTGREPSARSPSRVPRWLLWARGAGLLAILALAAFLIVRGVDWVGGPEAMRERFGWWAPAISALVHAPLAAAPFPSEAFALSHGALYGFWLGALVGWLGWWLGSLLEYGVLRRLRIDTGTDALRVARPGWLARFSFDHPVFLIGARQLPWGGYHIVNVAAAVGGVPFVRHLWCSAIAQVPWALLIGGAGAGLLRV